MTTPYNPQQNGVAERKNRMIMEAARAMLHDQDLPMHLWVEAARTTLYVQNRTPHKVLKKNTLEEVFPAINQRSADPGGYWWPPTYSTWTPTIVSFNFLVSLIVAQFTIFGSFCP